MGYIARLHTGFYSSDNITPKWLLPLGQYYFQVAFTIFFPFPLVKRF